MTPSIDVAVVLTTIDEESAAKALANELVERGLAACVSLVPGIHSVFRWEGRVETAGEILLVIKTTVEGARRIESYFEDGHPYDVPELIVLDPSSVGGSYGQWVIESVGV